MKWIIVLGMHRSGTSAFTRAVSTLGASMGEAAHLQKHWENIPMRRMNEKVLVTGGGKWDSPPDPTWLKSPEVNALVDRARALVNREYVEADAAVWKDPRTCLTVPFWLDVLPGDPVFLFIYRHPSEVAASLHTRNGFGLGHGYALWERYNADALAAVEGRPTVVLDYATLLTEPVEALVQVSSALKSFGLDLPGDPETADHGLVAQERHHTADEPDELAAIATPSQQALFSLLGDVRGVHQQLVLPQPVPEPNPLSVELLGLAARVRSMERDRKRERKGAPRPNRSAASAERPVEVS
jgi:hypothetical protein